MAINLKSTADLSANGVKALVYGQAGAGKTTLAATMPHPIILSAERSSVNQRCRPAIRGDQHNGGSLGGV